MDESGYCMESYMAFPVCNHTVEIGKENLGYTQGIMMDGVPFEAELWTNDTETCVSFILPEEVLEIQDDDEEEGLWLEEVPYEEKGVPDNTVEGIELSKESADYSVLDIGMVDRGYINEVDVIEEYVSYLEDMGLLEYTTKLRNGTLRFLTDVEGHNVVCVIISLLIDGEVQARTPLNFRAFPGREGMNRLKVVK